MKLSCVQRFATPWNTVHGILQAIILEWVQFSSPRDLPNLGITPRSSTLQVDSLPAEPPGKPEAVVGCIQIQCYIVPVTRADSQLPELLLSLRALPTPLSTAVLTFFFVPLQTQPSSTRTPLLRKTFTSAYQVCGLYLDGIQVLYHWIPGSYIN